MFEAAFVSVGQPVDDDAARLSAIAELEQLKCVIEARQAEMSAELDRDRDHRRTVADVALARRESPHRARQHLGLARVLADEMPHTMDAFRDGHLSEWRVTLIARETACLPLEARQTIDAELASDPSALAKMGDRQLADAVRRRAGELDAASVVNRRSNAQSDRRVTLRPAPDTMTWLTALVPVEQGVAAYAALLRAADTARAAGDSRGKGQVMADTLVERLTGQATADDVPVAVNLVISDQVLLGSSDEAAHLDGHGVLPPDLARAWVSKASQATLRRLYASPRTGQLVAMESRRRRFPQGLAQMIRFRDQVCTTAWCDAPVRHIDHVRAASDGGPTSFINGQGQCEACSLAKGSGRWAGRTGVPPPGHRPYGLPSRAEFSFIELPGAA